MIAQRNENVDELGQSSLDEQVRAFMHELLDSGRAEYFGIDDDGEFRFAPTDVAWEEADEEQAQTPPATVSMFYRLWLPLLALAAGGTVGTTVTQLLG